MWLDLIHALKARIEQKGLGKDDLPLCLTASQLGHQSSPAFDLRLRLELLPLTLLFLMPSVLHWNDTINSLGCPACQLQILRLSLHNHKSQSSLLYNHMDLHIYIYIYKHIYIYIYIHTHTHIFIYVYHIVLFFWTTLTNTDTHELLLYFKKCYILKIKYRFYAKNKEQKNNEKY